MKEKGLHLLWGTSLVVIGVTTLVLAGFKIAGIPLADSLVQGLGIADILALPVLAFTTVRKVKRK